MDISSDIYRSRHVESLSEDKMENLMDIILYSNLRKAVYLNLLKPTKFTSFYLEIVQTLELMLGSTQFDDFYELFHYDLKRVLELPEYVGYYEFVETLLIKDRMAIKQALVDYFIASEDKLVAVIVTVQQKMLSKYTLEELKSFPDDLMLKPFVDCFNQLKQVSYASKELKELLNNPYSGVYFWILFENGLKSFNPILDSVKTTISKKQDKLPQIIVEFESSSVHLPPRMIRAKLNDLKDISKDSMTEILFKLFKTPIEKAAMISYLAIDTYHGSSIDTLKYLWINERYFQTLISLEGYSYHDYFHALVDLPYEYGTQVRLSQISKLDFKPLKKMLTTHFKKREEALIEIIIWIIKDNKDISTFKGTAKGVLYAFKVKTELEMLAKTELFYLLHSNDAKNNQYLFALYNDACLLKLNRSQ